MKTKKGITKKGIEEAREVVNSYLQHSKESNRIQWQYDVARELSAIVQCHDMGLVDERGALTPRAEQLISEYQSKK